MAVFARTKRVSDPLDDRVKARILSSNDHHHHHHHHRLMTGYASSGSEHEADESCLSSLLVHAFFDLDESVSGESNASSNATTDDDDSNGSSTSHAITAVDDLLGPSRKSDPFGSRLNSDVVGASEALAGMKSSGSGFRRAVMARLRELGYNAAICKARWQSSGGLTGGNYEYIDVLVNDKENGNDERYIVDLDFATQFEIARATVEYGELVASLPAVMVAKVEELKKVVRIMAETAKRSLKSKDLSVPPWRKRRYMSAKWFGPYRRIVNPLPSAAGATVAVRGESHCRTVDFTPAPRRIVVPLRGTR